MYFTLLSLLNTYQTCYLCMPSTKQQFGYTWSFEAGAQQAVLETAKLKGDALVCMHEALPPGPARHHPNGRKVVWFAWTSFRDPTEFFQVLQSVPKAECSFYEILPTASPIPLIFDIEWVVFGVSADDVEQVQDRSKRLTCLIALVSKCLRSYGILNCQASDFIVKESHRLVAGGFKNSFHLIHPTIGFDRMSTQNYFIKQVLLPKMLKDPLLCYQQKQSSTAAATMATIVDTRIYTDHRAFRTPNSFKAGGSPDHAFRITSPHSFVEGLVSSHKPLPAYTLTLLQLKRAATIDQFFLRSDACEKVAGRRKHSPDEECARKQSNIRSCQ